MYAHVTVGHVDPDHLDKYVEKINTSSLPAVKGEPGYEGAFFQTEGDRQTLEDSGFADNQRSRTGSLLNITRNDPQYYQLLIADGSVPTPT